MVCSAVHPDIVALCRWAATFNINELASTREMRRDKSTNEI